MWVPQITKAAPGWAETFGLLEHIVAVEGSETLLPPATICSQHQPTKAPHQGQPHLPR